MGESEPTLRDVLGAVREVRDMVSANGGAINEIRGELGDVRVGLGDVRGRLARLEDLVAEHGKRLDRVEAKEITNGEALAALSGEVETGRETLLRELPQQLLAAVMTGIERSAYAVDLRTLQAEVAELKADVAELKRAAGE